MHLIWCSPDWKQKEREREKKGERQEVCVCLCVCALVDNDVCLSEDCAGMMSIAHAPLTTGEDEFQPHPGDAWQADGICAYRWHRVPVGLRVGCWDNATVGNDASTAAAATTVKAALFMAVGTVLARRATLLAISHNPSPRGWPHT